MGIYEKIADFKFIRGTRNLRRIAVIIILFGLLALSQKPFNTQGIILKIANTQFLWFTEINCGFVIALIGIFLTIGVWLRRI